MRSTLIRRTPSERAPYFRADETCRSTAWSARQVARRRARGRRRRRRSASTGSPTRSACCEALRERLRCKEVWVAGADRYRNPDEDLPADFADAPGRLLRRASACRTDAGAFIGRRCGRRCGGAGAARRGLPQQPAASASSRRPAARIAVCTARRPARAGRASSALKAELGRRWPMTGLLDMLKEADLRVGFTDAFATAAAREALDRATLRRAAAAVPLRPRHQRRPEAHGRRPARRHLQGPALRRGGAIITPRPLREATRQVVNATLRGRATPRSGARARRPAPRTASSSAPGTRT